MVAVRVAGERERAAIRNVLDGAALSISDTRLDAALARGTAFVAAPDEGGVVLGALVCDGERIVAVAVRRGRRDQGIGTALVGAAKRANDRLVAEFDPRVRPFWDAQGFELTDADEAGRLQGVWEA